MRKRMAAAMVALVAALMWAGMNLVSERSVSLMLERERTRALQEEAAIARAVALEIDGGDYARMQQAAQTVQEKYGSATLQVALVYKGMAMAGASLLKVVKFVLDGQVMTGADAVPDAAGKLRRFPGIRAAKYAVVVDADAVRRGRRDRGAAGPGNQRPADPPGSPVGQGCPGFGAGGVWRGDSAAFTG